jgi:hypothetical protein
LELAYMAPYHSAATKSRAAKIAKGAALEQDWMWVTADTYDRGMDIPGIFAAEDKLKVLDSQGNARMHLFCRDENRQSCIQVAEASTCLSAQLQAFTDFHAEYGAQFQDMPIYDEARSSTVGHYLGTWQRSRNDLALTTGTEISWSVDGYTPSRFLRPSFFKQSPILARKADLQRMRLLCEYLIYFKKYIGKRAMSLLRSHHPRFANNSKRCIQNSARVEENANPLL